MHILFGAQLYSMLVIPNKTPDDAMVFTDNEGFFFLGSNLVLSQNKSQSGIFSDALKEPRSHHLYIGKEHTFINKCLLHRMMLGLEFSVILKLTPGPHVNYFVIVPIPWVGSYNSSSERYNSYGSFWLLSLSSHF